MNQIRPTSLSLAALMVCLLAVGLWQIGEGSWIYAKARLAQLLLQRAWSRTLAGEANVKPWPWADTWPVARLMVPSRHIDLIVLEGAYGRMLAFGPGRLESGSTLRESGPIILTGHRDTHFRFVKRLRKGDQLVLQSKSGEYTSYRIREMRVVEAATGLIPMREDGPGLVLVTCYPFDSPIPGGPLRYVVTADKETMGERRVERAAVNSNTSGWCSWGLSTSMAALDWAPTTGLCARLWPVLRDPRDWDDWSLLSVTRPILPSPVHAPSCVHLEGESRPMSGLACLA